LPEKRPAVGNPQESLFVVSRFWCRIGLAISGFWTSLGKIQGFKPGLLRKRQCPYFFLWRFFLRRFLRLWVAILWPFLFFPLGMLRY